MYKKKSKFNNRSIMIDNKFESIQPVKDYCLWMESNKIMKYFNKFYRN